MKVVSYTLAALLGLAAVAPAQAVFVGGSLHTEYLYPDSSSLYEDHGNVAVTGPNTQIASSMGDGFVNLYASNNNLTADFLGSSSWNGADFNGFVVFDDTNSIGAITSVSIGGNTNMAGFDISRITFDADHIFVNWQGLSFDGDTVVSLNVNGAVPEPASWALMLGGFGAIGGAARARRRATAAAA